MDELPLPQSATPGTLIRRKYRVGRMIGEGAVGVVVEATHIDLNKPVAIKILRPEWQTPEIEARFEREARVAARLPADHIARVTDVGYTEAGECYLVMELLVGRDLADEIVARGKFPISEAVDLMLQAMAGVAEAHAHGLVHRDLKPANLFLVERRGRLNLKVLDFGLSKAPLREGETELTHTTSNFGTPQYMSPEQIQSAKHVDARSDQHALGMILFELITGQPPYDGPSLTSLTIAIATEPPPKARALRPEVPAALDEAIQRALAKKPAERFPDLLAFARAIGAFAGERARDPLELIAAALEFKPIPSSDSALVSAAVKADDKPRATVPLATTDALDKRATVPLVGADADDKRAPAQVQGSESTRSSPDGERDPGPITAEPIRTAARRRPKILGAVAAGVVVIGALVWALGFSSSSPSPADAPLDARSSEPHVAPLVTLVPLDPPAPALSGVSSALPDAPAPPASARPTGSLVSQGSAPVPVGSAVPSSLPRPKGNRGKRNPSSPVNPAGPSAREVFGED
jgi:serine/threonine protein kinase